MLTKRQLAEHLGTTVRHVDRMVEQRRIPFIKLGDARNAPVRFDPADVKRWIAAHRTEVA